MCGNPDKHIRKEKKKPGRSNPGGPFFRRKETRNRIAGPERGVTPPGRRKEEHGDRQGGPNAGVGPPPVPAENGKTFI